MRWQLVACAHTPMGKQTGLQFVQLVEPLTALAQVHTFIPFASFFKSFVQKAP